MRVKFGGGKVGGVIAMLFEVGNHFTQRCQESGPIFGTGIRGEVRQIGGETDTAVFGGGRRRRGGWLWRRCQRFALRDGFARSHALSAGRFGRHSLLLLFGGSSSIDFVLLTGDAGDHAFARAGDAWAGFAGGGGGGGAVGGGSGGTVEACGESLSSFVCHGFLKIVEGC